MKYYDIDQYSDEYWKLRCGLITASNFKHMMSAKTSLGYKKIIYTAAYERHTGETPETFKNEWMKRGNELEPVARDAYSAETFNVVENGGFFIKDKAGASPDGRIDDGLLEIKCPAFNTHIDYLKGGKLPSTYKYQVHGQMYVSDRQWCEFVSFCPGLRMFIVRVKRDDKICQEIELRLAEAEQEITEIMSLL